MSGPSDLRAIAATGEALQTRFRTYPEFVAALRELLAQHDEAGRRAGDRAAAMSTAAVRVEEAEAALAVTMRRLEAVKADLRRKLEQ